MTSIQNNDGKYNTESVFSEGDGGTSFPDERENSLYNKERQAVKKTTIKTIVIIL